MKQLEEKSGYGFGTILKLTAVLSAILALLCFAAPSVRKSDALRTTGEATMNEMRAAVTVVSYYSAQQIGALAEEPTINANYKFLAGLLSQLNTQQNYQKSYLLYRAEGKTLRCLVDGSYRDNAEAGTDYFAPGMDYPISGAYKPVKTVVDKIYSGKITGGYTTELVTRQDFKKVAVTCLPVYGTSHAVVAVLCVETDPGDTAYHMAGSVNLYYAGLAFVAVFAICFLLLTLRRKYLLHKKQKQEEQERLEQETSQLDAANLSMEEDVPADSATQQPAESEDVQQAPGSNIDTLQ
ncbi:hypothetical protein ACS3UN_04210 [Oscillospiraceae bacterium LTW-04]|nr:hypothetical protein RBH76_06255 [Oscillospiraceae bacterium MB24-C1]